ncbi:MAG: glycosyltransferase family 2 protein [Candidatus Velthaea sp.]
MNLDEITYVLPIRRVRREADDADLAEYLASISRLVRVVIADGSPPELFARHARRWAAGIVHVPIDPDCIGLNGKVNGVRTAMRRVQTERVVIADDDVRYDPFTLRAVAALLDRADVVRPQNVFTASPWHVRLDTARSLLNRVTGGDWPGTLAVRRSRYERAGGYDADVLFENLELVRTLCAAGGSERIAYDAYVARRPPTARHFWSQRVRQAYDEFARPLRFAMQLALLPAIVLATARLGARAPVTVAALAVAAAECGRRRAGGARVYCADAALYAPLWLAERAITAWCALALRYVRGGVRYSRGRIRRAAHAPSELAQRSAAAFVQGTAG